MFKGAFAAKLGLGKCDEWDSVMCLLGSVGGVTPSMCTELQESWEYCKGLSIPLVIVFSVTYSLVVRQMVRTLPLERNASIHISDGGSSVVHESQFISNYSSKSPLKGPSRNFPSFLCGHDAPEIA